MSKDQCRKLISLYGASNWLWDARDTNYTNRGLREDAWLNISREMNMPVKDLKKKMESLMGSYRREKSREKKSLITGSGRDDIYKSSWFAYDSFAFLSDRNDPGSTQESRIDGIDADRTVRVGTVPDVAVPHGTLEDGTVRAQDPTPANDNVQAVDEQQQSPEHTNNTNRTNKRSKKRPAKEIDDLYDETITEAFKLLQQCADSQPASETVDSYSSFGNYIANELRKYDPNTLAHVKHDICRIIFQADTGAYQQHGYYTSTYDYLRPSSSSSSYTAMLTPSPLPPQSPMPPPLPPQSSMPPPLPPQSPMPPTLPPQSPIPPSMPPQLPIPSSLPPQSPMPPSLPPQSPVPPPLLPQSYQLSDDPAPDEN